MGREGKRKMVDLVNVYLHIIEGREEVKSPLHGKTRQDILIAAVQTSIKQVKINIAIGPNYIEKELLKLLDGVK